MEKQSTLPEKWAVKNNPTVGEWFDKQANTSCYTESNLNEYLHSHNNGDKSIYSVNTGKSFAHGFTRNGFTEITFEQFKQYILKEKIMRTITAEQAQAIVDIACPTWTTRLANEWALKIVKKEKIEISEESYKTMRQACTDSQNKLFDEIFGADKKYKAGDWITLLQGTKFKDGTTTKQIVEIKECDGWLCFEGEMSSYSGGYNSFNDAEGFVRLATEEEIKKATTIKRGTVCTIVNKVTGQVYLRVADGEGTFFIDGSVTSTGINWGDKYEIIPTKAVINI